MADDAALLERRKDGWTWTKEILGTMIGVIGVLAIPGSWLYTTIDDLKLSREVMRMEITALKDGRSKQDVVNDRIAERVEKVLEAINDVRVKQAAVAAVVVPTR